MTSTTPSLQTINQRIQQRRSALAEMRAKVKERRASGESGISCSHWLSDQIDEFIRTIMAQQVEASGRPISDSIAVIAVGGNGRRRPAPYSDVDLLLLMDARQQAAVEPVLSAAVRDCWDTGVQLGASVRTAADVVRFAGEDIQFATSVIETRPIFGNTLLAEATIQQVVSKVLSRNRQNLILQLLVSRREEWLSRGNSVNQLEPDVKRSPGGLRDLHMLRWISFIRHGDPSPEALCNAGDISRDELRELLEADEYLTAIRLDLHNLTNLKQDVLTRELQLQISSARGISGTDRSRPVEVFMQTYFGHTSRVAAVARRVADVPRKLPFLTRLRNAFLPQKSPQGFLIVDGVLQVPESQLPLLQDPIRILDVFVTAAEHRIRLAPELRRYIGQKAATLPDEPTYEMAERFRDVLRHVEGLPETLRAMYETGVLQWLVPPFGEIRNLMQFNQYHSFTVDEHTLKAIDEMAAFANDESPVGSAYQGIRHRGTLHLALLMHDVGKGRGGDHSIVGEQLAEQVATRLQMAANKKSMLMFLVRHHLIMPDIAFRRDITDAAMLVDFARLIGAPELLRMLYCLTVADIRAVGPDVWSDWKGELLADLYNRAIQILSGRPYNHLERERLQKIRLAVRKSIVPIGTGSENDLDEWSRWADSQLDALPPFYLMTEQPARIARDLDMIQQLSDADVKIEGEYDAETETVSYRVFAPGRFGRGSFHCIAGILSGLRMNILAAQVCTTSNGVVIAAFRVSDNDFTGPVPHSRIEDVAVAIGDVLTGKKSVESVFRRSSLYRFNRRNPVIIKQDPKVGIDNDCSERFTVVDVFATDTQGLLYTLAHTLFNNGLTVHLARIATNIDQVVDVFYVLDENGRKVEDAEKLEKLRSSLLEEIGLLTSGA
ncbi:MAG: [protein-PII] uridylyltransferase [Planctomycetaceae bacterium]|nr:[protein-PII] uridylyltransferase [Planctomycetaceae bacterium]